MSSEDETVTRVVYVPAAPMGATAEAVSRWAYVRYRIRRWRSFQELPTDLRRELRRQLRRRQCNLLVHLLVPYRFRRLHRWYAKRHHYFWLPCHLCNVEFGAHELHKCGGKSYFLYPVGSRGWTICPRCTRAGRGTPPP